MRRRLIDQNDQYEIKESTSVALSLINTGIYNSPSLDYRIKVIKKNQNYAIACFIFESKQVYLDEEEIGVEIGRKYGGNRNIR